MILWLAKRENSALISSSRFLSILVCSPAESFSSSVYLKWSMISTAVLILSESYSTL